MGNAPSVARRRYVALDGFRGICACMVVMLHFVSQGHISALPVVMNGFLFVDFFFVLSGFVIGSSYGDRLAAGFRVTQFMWLRLGRIYPLHVTLLLAFLAFELFIAFVMPQAGGREPFTGVNSLWAFVQSLLLVQLFGAEPLGWNGPSWSVAAEIWTYLIFALVMSLARRWLIPICAFIILAAPMVLVMATDRYLNVVDDGALVRCLFGFALGVLGWRCAEFTRAVTLPKWGDHILELLTISAIVLFISVAGSGPLSLAVPLLFFVAVLIFARESGVVSQVLRLPPFILLGALSYSIYMTHSFLYYRLLNGLDLLSRKFGWDLVVRGDGYTSVGGGALFGDAMTFLFLAVVIVCSYFTYRFIELPGQALVRRLMGDRERGALPATPGAP